MRNPRTNPIKGDVLEHCSGEKRAVVASGIEHSTVQYRDGSLVSECSQAEWQEWARQTTIVDFG